MPYYPKSQIKTGLYTNGGEYNLSTTKENYVGDYYELSNGKVYTGKTPSLSSILLEVPLLQELESELPLNENPPTEVITSHNYSYSSPKKFSNPTFLPQFNSPLPTKDDYNREEYIRYFCIKNNEIKYLEIDQITFNKLKSKSQDILWSLYTPFSIPWKITKDLSLNKSLNFSQVQKVILENNLRGFEIFIKNNYSQYSPSSTPIDPTTSPSIGGSGGTSSGGTSSGGGY
tara:strand:+ start:523 stop:1212 length:690 start_codon:yes stop_codon:yes gene_type:complete